MTRLTILTLALLTVAAAVLLTDWPARWDDEYETGAL